MFSTGGIQRDRSEPSEGGGSAAAGPGIPEEAGQTQPHFAAPPQPEEPEVQMG